MALLKRFDPPAFFTDFDAIPGQLDKWNEFMSIAFDFAIETARAKLDPSGTVQFYNPTKEDHGAAVALALTWNAFPKELLRTYGRARALVEADRSRLGLTEYCEWHVERDPQTNAIVRVTFTSEPPEYWGAMYGGPVVYERIGTKSFTFPGSPDVVLQKYRELVSPHVRADDLVTNGAYDPLNKWNSTHGIVHLTAEPNTLPAEVQLGANATVLYRDARGDVLVEPEPLICCSKFGGPDRNSDPTIGATVNALARLGAMISLANPVGLYMDHIDLTGWSAPKGVEVEECVRVVRGDARTRLIERLVVEVPRESGFTVSDLSIGGVPIAFGGEIAECITVKLVGTAAALGSVRNAPSACGNRCCVDPAFTVGLGHAIPNDEPAPPGTVVAFELEGGAA
ncbi:MAG TPA: hypothetical protein VN224_10855 [Xanthomonadales bacterium]|nr:hypothetical protein [Xanthomonadales bacterium]